MDKKPALQLTLIIAFLICFINTSSFSEPVTPSSDYTIAADDILDIKVLQDENLTKILTVDKDGFISLPYIDKVKVAGLTPKGAAELIADRLRSGNFLVKPTVTVLIKENLGQKIMVFGLVKNPGAFYLKGKTFILDLLSKIELAKEGAAGKMVITRRDTSGKENTIGVDLYALLMNGDMSQNIQILSGDSIVVSAKESPPQVASGDDYAIAPDDVLDINVWKDDNLTKVLTVDKDGFITLPYLNQVKVAGLSPKQVADFMAARLKTENYLLEPKVTVSVKEYRGQKIMVFGLVQKPGMHYLKGKTFALDLLSEIGNTIATPDGKMVPGGKMVITRRDTSGKENTIEVDLYALLMNGDMSQNIQILSGDSIVISRKSTGQQIYVLGEVKNPGPYTVERDLTVLQALQMAGGFTDFADKGKAKVIRERNGVKKDIIVNLNKVRKGDKSQDITLEAGDVLVALRSWL